MRNVDTLTRTLTVVGKRQRLREIPLRNDVLEHLIKYRNEEEANSFLKKRETLLVRKRSSQMHRDAVKL